MPTEPAIATVSSSRPSLLRELPMALLRVVVGWHFLYEGLTKLFTPGWTSAGYLQSSTGFMSEHYQRLAADPQLLSIVDQLNIWGLLLIGVALMLGLLTRFAALCGVVLLALYYLAYPPLFGTEAPGVAEGHYLIINKNLIELCALVVVMFLPASSWGLDGLFFRRWWRRGTVEVHPDRELTGDRGAPVYLGPISRRQVLARMAGLPMLGGFVLAVLKKYGWTSFEEAQLSASVDGASGATLKRFEFTGLDQLKGHVPRAKIGDVELSRVILGGNLIGGWAHARDLIYVSKLVKAYHHREKVFETFALAEACGVNTIITNPQLCDIMNDYWKSTGGKIQFISDCGGKEVLEMVQKSIDNGACACYIQGGVADRLVAEENFDLIAQALELIRKNGLPAGIGAHKLDTVQSCVDHGFDPDFWMKTLHVTSYWSAQPETKRDNIWCEEPDETIAYMQTIEKPWIAFKTLAAGALHPKTAFKYAFKNGADFICVGMYDFQMVDDVNIAYDVLAQDPSRQRPWRAQNVIV